MACNKPGAPDCFKTTGELKSVQRALGEIHTIDLDDNINLIIHHDSLPKVIVNAGTNLIDKIITEESNGTLKIYNDNRCNFMRRYDVPIDVHVHTPKLRKIYYNGGGSVTSGSSLQFPYLLLESWNSGSEVNLSIDTDSLYAVIHTGVSNITFSGTADYLYLYSAGNSIFHSEDLQANNVHCNNGSTGDFFVNAVSTLHVEVRSYSTTWYRGNPVVSVVGSGTGNVVKSE